MKTNWNYDYLWGKLKDGKKVHQWANDKKHEFESKTGVPWSWENAHGRLCFSPILRSIIVQPQVEFVTDKQIETVKQGWQKSNKWYVGFVMLSEMTGYNLKSLMPIILAAVRQQKASLSVNRRGLANSVRFK